MSMVDLRLVKLEENGFFQEKRLDKLAKQLEELRKQLAGLRDELTSEGPANDPPPHYNQAK